jgi:hypothetical protein
MWLNRVVYDVENNILEKEKIFIENPPSDTQGSFGQDVLGNWVEEWYSED